MSRQIKSVSIPERLFERLEDIPNFSAWVIQALEENPQASASIVTAASNRRKHLRDLEDVLSDLQDIRSDLNRIRGLPPAALDNNIGGLVRAVEEVEKCWSLVLENRRRQA